MRSLQNHTTLYYLLGLSVLMNFSGLFIPLMDPDAGVYASISKTMAQQNDFVNLYFMETDWLDKPHFPFWVTALSFKIFGYHDWAYKLPGILFVIMGAAYTYLFARKFYNKSIALWSVVILLTAMHIIISNNDVRAEPYLTGLIIAAIYHFSCSLSKNLSRHLLIACVFTACAIMTKGIYALVPIGGAVAGELFIKRQWKQVFHWRWLVALLLVTLFITPELYCLWKQFDLQPEKTVRGMKNVSGIKFFFWDSQFGRFFNTGPIKGEGSPVYFLLVLLWAFLPWSLIMYTAMAEKIRNLIKGVRAPFNEWYMFSGSLLTLLLFSFSGFQLPHYTNIIFPLLAVISSHFIAQLTVHQKPVLRTVQNILSLLLPALFTFFLAWYNPADKFWLISACIFVLAVLLLLPRWLQMAQPYIPFLRSAFAVIAIGLILNISFYPDLLFYQSGNRVAAYMNKNYPGEPLGKIGFYFPSGEFYLYQQTFGTTHAALRNKTFKKARFLFVTEEEKKQLELEMVGFETLKAFKEYHITILTIRFLNPETRAGELKVQYLIRLL